MNIFEYIKKDHQNVAELFKQFKTAPKSQKKQIANTIAKELLIHLEAEQETFYSELEKHKETCNVVQHGWDEHADIEQQIDAIIGATSVTSAWEKKVIQLQKIVEHHVQEEEGVIHTLAKKVLTAGQATELKHQMHECKKKIEAQIDPASSSTGHKKIG